MDIQWMLLLFDSIISSDLFQLVRQVKIFSLILILVHLIYGFHQVDADLTAVNKQKKNYLRILKISFRSIQQI